ncbi:unnamed protein product, partial [Lymnaea stagnalis]
ALLTTVASLPGLFANLLNIKTFITMGLEDGITVSFLVLSLSDLGYLAAQLCGGVASGFNVLELWFNFTVWFPVQPFAVAVYCPNIAYVVYAMTVLTTTYLAVVRCMCVARPLHFKNTFTRARTVWTLVVFALVSVGSYIPLLLNMGIAEQFDDDVGAVRPTLWFSAIRPFVKGLTWAARDTVLAILSQTVIPICVFVMTRCLRQASNFRKSASGTNAQNSEIKKGPGKIFTGKELLVVQQVLLVSTLYVVCNTPKVVVILAGFLQPEFSLGKRYNNIYVAMISLRDLFEQVNSSVNILIYYKYNRKFRS